MTTNEDVGFEYTLITVNGDVVEKDLAFWPSQVAVMMNIEC